MLHPQVASLRQQLKQSNQKLTAAEARYATHASSMAILQNRAETAEASAQEAQRGLTKLQVQSSPFISARLRLLHVLVMAGMILASWCFEWLESVPIDLLTMTTAKQGSPHILHSYSLTMELRHLSGKPRTQSYTLMAVFQIDGQAAGAHGMLCISEAF